MSWIKIETALADKPEVMRLAAILKTDEIKVIGHLVLFWSWVDGQVSATCPEIVCTKSGIDRRAGIDGFCDAMLAVNWLSVDGDKFSIPNFHYHMSKSAKTRAEDQKRKHLSRNNPDKNRTNVRNETGQKPDTEPDKPRTREEKRREDINNIEGRPSEVIIPAKLNDPECLAAAERWFDYLDSKQLQDKSPRGNEIALEAWWRQMARLGRDGFLEAVDQSMAAGRWNVELKKSSDSSRSSKSRYSDDFMHVLKVCKAFPGRDGFAKRESQLSTEQRIALKESGGSAQLLEAAKHENSLKVFADLFEQHLKDIRHGLAASN